MDLREKRLADAKDLLKQVSGLNVVSSKGGKTLKSGELKIEFKTESRDGGKTGKVSAYYSNFAFNNEPIATVTYGGGQGQFNNIFNALQEVQHKVTMRLHRQIGEWEQIIKKYK